MKEHSRLKPTKIALLFWCLFIGVGAFAGAIGMLVAPDGSALGMNGLLKYFQVLPFADILFQNFIFSGIALLCVNGITNLIAAALLLMNKKSGIIMGGIFGVTLMLWITIQFVIFPTNFMSVSYFIFGLCQALTGYAAYVFYSQESFVFNENEYTSIGTNSSELVVYFSRMGYTRKIAYEAANKSGAEIYEISFAERTSGTLGFWWCGRFGIHGWDMPIEEVSVDLSKYDKVTVCSPIWVFGLCGPVRSFCKQSAGKIKKADYILVHHMSNKFESVANEMDKLIGLNHCGFRSIKCKMGKYTEL